MVKALRTMDPAVRIIAARVARERNSLRSMANIAKGLRTLDWQTVKDVAFVLRWDLDWSEADCEQFAECMGSA